MDSNMLINFHEMDYTNTDSDSSQSSDSLPAFDPLIQSYSQASANDVQLEVSGNSFVMGAYDFQKLARLPWKRIHASAYRLDASFSPDSFEKCLDYVQCGTLPKRKHMKSYEKSELTSMAANLGLTDLADHMASKKKSGFFGCGLGKKQ